MEASAARAVRDRHLPANGWSRTQGHLLLSTDALETFLDVGDEGLEEPERIFNMGTSFNTGMSQEGV